MAAPQKIAPFKTSDPAFNRWADQISASLNSIIDVGTTALQALPIPVPTAQNVGQLLQLFALNGKFAGFKWITPETISSTVPLASTTVAGITKLNTLPASASNPIALGANDASVTNARTPTGAAGGVLTGAYPNPSGLAATAVTPATYGDATNVARVQIGADGRVTDATDVPIAFPPALQEMPLTLPTTDDTADSDEFSGSLVVNTGSKTLTFGSAAAWTYSTLGASGTPLVDPTVVTGLNPTTAVSAPVWNLDATSRVSRARLQLGWDGLTLQGIQLAKGVTLPTNGFVWARMSQTFVWDGSTFSGTYAPFNLKLQDSGGSHFVAIGLSLVGGELEWNYATDAGAGSFSAQSPKFWQIPWAYVGIWKQGTSYQAAIADENGNWSFGAPMTQTTALTKACLQFEAGKSISGYGSPVMDIDFFRIGTRLP